MNPLRLDTQLCFSLYAASRAVTAAYGPLLAPLGVTYPQYLALLVLWEDHRVSVKQLGERLRLDSGTLSPVLTKLEARGLVTRTRDLDDGRVVRVALTKSGRALERKAKNLPARLVCQMGLTHPAVARLREELSTLTETLRAATAASTQKEHTT